MAGVLMAIFLVLFFMTFVLKDIRDNLSKKKIKKEYRVFLRIDLDKVCKYVKEYSELGFKVHTLRESDKMDDNGCLRFYILFEKDVEE